MSPIEELKQTTEHLCQSIDQIIASEKFFCDNISFQIERMSWEILCMTNDLKDINAYIGIS